MKTITNLPIRWNLRHFFSAVFLLFSMAVSAQISLKTVPPLTGGNGSGGTTFQLVVKSPIKLDSIYAAFSNTPTADIWYSATDTVGAPNITTTNGWTLLATVSFTGLSVGTTSPVIQRIPYAFNLVLTPGKYRFYVGCNTCSAVYTTWAATNQSDFIDPFVTIRTGTNYGYGGNVPNPINHPRQFNGGVVYSPFGSLNDAAVLSVDSPKVFCAGNQNIYATIANFGGNRINSVTVNWSFDGVVQTPIAYTGLLDTLNGLGNTAQILLGNKNFPSGTPKAIKVWTSLPNGVADTSNFNDTINVFKSASIAGGIYTINSGAAASSTNFIDFTSFFSLVNQYGVCSSVTLNVVSGSGPYVEQVNIKNFNGSPTRTLTINGNGETVDFAATVTDQRATIAIENSSYVTIDSLNATASGTLYGTALFMNNIGNVTIRNSSFMTDTISTSSVFASVVISGSQTSVFTVTNFSDLVFENNSLKGGYYGLTFYGNSTTPSTNVVVRNNKITGFYYYGAYLYYANGMLFEQNDISRPYRTGLGFTYAVYMFGHTNQVVNRNAIHNLYDGSLTSTGAVYGMYNGSDATPSNSNVVMNNLFYGFNHAGTVYGLYDGGSDNTYYYNNTISIDNTSATAGLSYGIYKPSASVGTEFQNNIISITRGGPGTIYGMYYSNPAAISDYNNVYINSAGSGAHNYGYNGSAKLTLADWQTAGYGVNDIEANPNFTNVSLDDFQPNNVSLNAAGFPAPQVVEDFNGAPRDVLANDIGSFNINSPALDAALNKVLINTPFCAGLQNVSAIISNNGIARIDSLMINWTVNGVLQTPINYQTLLDTIGSVAGNTDTVLLTNYNFASGLGVNFVAWVSAPNGTTPDAFPPNDTSSAYAGGALVGNYTVNPNIAASATNYLDISTLSTNLSNFGICGPVNVTVSAGNYFENISLSNVAGSGPSNPIVIDGVDSSLAVISYAGAGTGIGVVSIDKTDNVTIKNFSLIHTATTNAAGAIVANSSNVTISNCYIQVDTTSTSSVVNGLLISSSISTNATDAKGRNITFESNTIKGGYYGFRAWGSITDGVKAPKLINNNFSNPYYYGIYSYYTDSMEVIGNKVNMINRGNAFGYGIYLNYSPNVIVSENNVKSLYYGMYYYMFTYTWPKTRKTEFVNNMVFSRDNYALYMYYADSVNLYHNTFASNSATNAAAIINSSGTQSENYDVRNNIFYSNGAQAISSNVPVATLFDKFDYNSFYTSGTNLMTLNSIAYNNLASFTSAFSQFNANSIEGDPVFLSATIPVDLHVVGAVVNGLGDSTVGVTKDIDGDARPLAGSTAVDMGADEFNPPSDEIGISNLVSPTTQCGLTASEPVSIEITNLGLTTASNFPATFIIDGGTPVTETVTASILTGTTFTFTFTATANLAVTGPHTVKVYVSLAGDLIKTNDTILETIINIPLIATFPYSESFENGAGGWTVQGTGSSFAVGAPTGSVINSASDGTKAWITNLTGNYNNSEGGWVQSPCMDMSNLGIPLLEFDIWYDSEFSWDGAVLQSSIDGGANWNKIGSFGTGGWYTDNSINGLTAVPALEPSGEGWTGGGSGTVPGSGGWIPMKVLLDTLANQPAVLFRFAFGSDGSVNSYEGFGFDNFRLYDSIQTNIQIDSMVTLLSDCGLNPAEDITVSITNVGSTPFMSTPITYVLNNGTPVTETITDTIKGGTNYIYTFNTKANFSVAGGYALDVYLTISPADSIPANDTLSVNIVRSPSTIMDTTATVDAFTDFETDNGDFSAYGANSSWAWGTPSSFYISSAFSGTKAWVTGLTAGHNANELSYLETQCYDFSGLAATEPVYIQFKNIFKTQIGIDNVWMESSLDNGKTWTKVLASVTAVNWYTNTTTNVWSGFSNGGVGVWIPVVNELLGLGGKSKVKFRFVFESDGTNQNEGFGIDDFRINLTVSAGDDLFNGDALLSIQPNPSNGQFNLIFNNYAKGVYQVAVMNVNGQLVNAENVAVASKFQSKPMNLDNLDKGVYFVKVTNGSSVTTQKLVIK